MQRRILTWLGLGGIGFAVLPWYAIEDGFWRLAWLTDGWPFEPDFAPALLLVLGGEKTWLAPLGLLLILGLLLPTLARDRPRLGIALSALGTAGLAYLLLQGFAIGIRGWSFAFLEGFFGPLEDRQFGLGYGALVTAGAFLFLLTRGLALRGAAKNDAFLAGAIGLVIALVTAFILFPVSRILATALQDDAGLWSPLALVTRFFDDKIWGLGCLGGGVGCGAAWNSLFLAITVGAGTTLFGLAFALILTRSGFRMKKLLRALTVLPIITPPFVIGLAIILLFGRSGAITQFVAQLFDIPASRWIYGLPGIWFAQMLAFTPIAFLVLVGVVEGVSPSMEEAAQTLRADRWRTFTSVSLPLMRPGLANAFLLGFIESMADFGNPFVLGGNYDVLSTEIFFAIVGAQLDPGRAAVLALVLLGFTLSAFYIQRRWLGQKSYTTVTGKGDAGRHCALPRSLSWLVYGLALPWLAVTFVIYGTILFGGFTEIWGRDHSLTLRHYGEAFGVVLGSHGLVWSGGAWNSFFTTLTIAAVSAPLTAGIGLLIAYLLARQNFVGKQAFEFVTLLSFAIPGTVIGVSYVMAFNVPPIELTGSGAILVLCFMFRNMPVSVRAGVAALSQLDKSLDEASIMLRASTLGTLRRIILPLLRPAILAALVFSFVRAITAVSAIIFLVSADYDMATSYIIGRVENGDYGIAIAYCSVLILVMLLTILALQLVIGERRLGRAAPASKQLSPAGSGP